MTGLLIGLGAVISFLLGMATGIIISVELERREKGKPNAH